MTPDKAFSDPNATYVAWDGEFTWYALLKTGHVSNIEQWRSVDVWRVAVTPAETLSVRLRIRGYKRRESGDGLQ